MNKPKSIKDVIEDLSDLVRVLSYEYPQITDLQIMKRLNKDIEVLEKHECNDRTTREPE